MTEKPVGEDWAHAVQEARNDIVSTAISRHLVDRDMSKSYTECIKVAYAHNKAVAHYLDLVGAY